MSTIVLASFAIRAIAVLTACRLLYSIRDWRLAFFAAAIAFLTVDQGLLLLKEEFLWPMTFRGSWQQFAALFVSILLFLTMIFLEQVINSYRLRTRSLSAANESLKREVSAKQEIEEALSVSEISNRTKSRFLANMSHELRTPLNSVIGFSEIMEAELFGPLGSPEYKEYATDIKHSGQHLLAIVNDLLDLAKIESGQFEIQDTTICLDELLNSCQRLIKQTAMKSELELTFDVSPDLPHLRADQRLLKQIMINLLSNAVKFTHPGGQIIVSARPHEDYACVISVQDNGIGMLPAHIEKALTPFAQIENLIQQDHQGTGLGLPLSKSLVELHGGTMEIESQLAVGTTITLKFPLDRAIEPITFLAQHTEERIAI